MAKASIILILLQWEAIADLTNRCAVCWDGLARVGHEGKSYILEYKFLNSHFLIGLLHLAANGHLDICTIE